MPGRPLLPRLAGALGASLALYATTVGIVGATALQSAPSATYYRTRDLDVRPGIMVRVMPDYPIAAARGGISGKVVVRLYINEKGNVDRVETVRATPPGYFEQAAERAFRAARFSPGRKGKQAVKAQLLIEVSFDAPPAASPARKR
ncbi:MAG: TonB family protein [Burkholderiales bacterium]